MKILAITHNLNAGGDSATQTNHTAASRLITVIRGIPYYRSSGESSYHQGTWFPFFGVLEKRIMTFNRGFYNKPSSTSNLQESENLKRLLRDFPDNKNLYPRFLDVYSMLVSSTLGGGMWDTVQGKALLLMLKQEFPSYYQNSIEEITIEVVNSYDYDEIEAVNQWICTQALVNSLNDLTQNVRSIEGLYSTYSSSILHAHNNRQKDSEQALRPDVAEGINRQNNNAP